MSNTTEKRMLLTGERELYWERTLGSTDIKLEKNNRQEQNNETLQS